MFNSLKNEIEKDFDKEKNLREILSKVEGVSKMKWKYFKYALAPICISILVILGVYNHILTSGITPQMSQNTEDTQKTESKDKEWIIEEVQTGPNKTTNDLAQIIPHWEDMTISQQYIEATFMENKYTTKQTDIDNSNIEKYIGIATLKGHDVYTQIDYETKGNVYSIKGINKECAIAIQFENNSGYYVYANLYYRPETLRQFVEDLNLKDTAFFGLIYYNYWEQNSKGEKEYSRIKFLNVDNEKIWNMLFDNLELENVYADDAKFLAHYDYEILVTVNVPLLGYNNISIQLTDKGYMITNILDTRKGFYIGEDKVRAFLEYLKNNYDGYKLVYPTVYNTAPQANETGTKNDQIVMYDNTTKKTTTYNITTNNNQNYIAPGYDPQTNIN